MLHFDFVFRFFIFLYIYIYFFNAEPVILVCVYIEYYEYKAIV